MKKSLNHFIVIFAGALIIFGFWFSAYKETGPTAPPIVEAKPFVLDTIYITGVEWPAKTEELEGEFVCNTGGNSIAQNGNVEQRIIGGKTYCVTTVSEGAAGSMYSTYTYLTAKDNGLIKTSFTLRLVQCENYDDPKKTECKIERQNFNPDKVITGI